MRIIKTAIVTILIIVSSYSSGYSRIERSQSDIQTPEDVARLLSREFTYVWQMPSQWQAPQDTITSKKGSCIDFAILSQTLLSKAGIHCDIAVIKFKKLNVAHAICAWRDKRGYSFMTNKEYVQTRAQSVKAAVSEYYPDWEEIVFTAPDQKKGEVIRADGS